MPGRRQGELPIRQPPRVRRGSARAKQHESVVGKPIKSAPPADTIEFVEEPQIEVTESFVSDTMIQRLFRHRSNVS